MLLLLRLIIGCLRVPNELLLLIKVGQVLIGQAIVIIVLHVFCWSIDSSIIILLLLLLGGKLLHCGRLRVLLLLLLQVWAAA